MAVTLPVHVLLKGVDRVTPTLRRASAHLQRFGKRSQQVGSAINRNIGLPMTALGAISLRTALRYERAMNRVQAVTKDVTDEEMEALGEKARELGRTMPQTAGDVAEAMGFMGMAGQDAGEILESVESVLRLATIGQLDMARAADLATNIMGQFELQAEDSEDAVDILAATVTGANTDLEQMAEAFTQVGGTAKGSGLELAEVAAAVGLLGNKGRQASLAGTSLRKIIVSLLDPTSEAAAALDQMGIAQERLITPEGTITTLAAVVQALEEGLGLTAESIAEVSAELDKLDEAGASVEEVDARMQELGRSSGQLRDLFRIFGLRGAPAMIDLLSAGSDQLREFTTEVSRGGVSLEMMEVIMRGLPGEMARLTAAAEDLSLAIGEGGLVDFFTDLSELARDLFGWFSNLSPATRRWTLRVIGAVMAGGLFATALGKIAGGLGLVLKIMVPIVVAMFSFKGLIIAAGVALGWLAHKAIQNWGAIKQAGLDAIDALIRGWNRVNDFIPFLGDQTLDVAPVFGQAGRIASAAANAPAPLGGGFFGRMADQANSVLRIEIPNLPEGSSARLRGDAPVDLSVGRPMAGPR